MMRLYLERYRDSRVVSGAIWLAVFCLVVVTLCSRRPDVLLRPQFYAEDGLVFYQQAHELGFLRALMIPYGGYFHLIPRVVAGLAQLLPLSAAPLLFNSVALSIQTAPAVFLLSSRMSNVGPIRARALLAFLYVGMPRIAELQGDLVGSHFHLAVLSFLVLIALPPNSRAWRVFDLVALMCGALTGPFCIILLPVALFVFIKRRERWTINGIWILAAGAAIQTAALTILSERPQSTLGLGATLPLFFRIVSSKIFLPLFLGGGSFFHLVHGETGLTVLSCIVTVLGATLLAYAFLKGSVGLQALVLFGTTILAASLKFPLATTTGRQWEVLLIPGAGARYWYVPCLAVMGAVVWLFSSSKRGTLRIVSGVLLVMILITVVSHWRYGPLPDMHFDMYAREFAKMPPGARLKIPICPPGWSFEITKTSAR